VLLEDKERKMTLLEGKKEREKGEKQAKVVQMSLEGAKRLEIRGWVQSLTSAAGAEG